LTNAIAIFYSLANKFIDRQSVSFSQTNAHCACLFKGLIACREREVVSQRGEKEALSMANQDDPTIVAAQAKNADAGGETTGTKIPGEQNRWSWKRLSAGRLGSTLRLQSLPRLKRKKKTTKREDNWREWSRFRLWRRTRPFWGAILIMIAGLLVLWGPIELLPFALLPGSNIWVGILVGGILFIMGLIQLLVPSNALVTGSIAVVLSLVSLLVASGGFGIGMFLGIIGGAMGVAWQPASRPRGRFTYKILGAIKKSFPRSR
jgi:Family of unknown function (DUF6114)